MARDDISKNLVHWTKGLTYDDAFSILRQIVFEGRLLGGTGFIRDGSRCVCFTEAPEAQFHRVLGRYKPFGIRVSKAWLFAQGGRPVIYQSHEEYELLQPEVRWRHVRYEPNQTPPIDFSWEREWRIQTPELAISPEHVVIILPGEKWAKALEQQHLHNEHMRIHMESIAYGDWAELQTPKPFQYRYSVIEV